MCFSLSKCWLRRRPCPFFKSQEHFNCFLFIIFYFYMLPRLTLNWLYILLATKACATTLNLYGAWDWTLGLIGCRQVLHQMSFSLKAPKKKKTSLLSLSFRPWSVSHAYKSTSVLGFLSRWSCSISVFHIHMEQLLLLYEASKWCFQGVPPLWRQHLGLN